MSRIQEWVDNASDQTIAKVFDTKDADKAITVWSILSKGDDGAERLVRIYKIVDPNKLVSLAQVSHRNDHSNHECMVPKWAKAEFSYPSGPSAGDLINGVSLCLDVEDPLFPLCLKDGELSHELNFGLTSYQWVPTALQAYKSNHYDFDKKDVKDLCYITKHATGNACDHQWGIL
jgi:hypothetical protein